MFGLESDVVSHTNIENYVLILDLSPTLIYVGYSSIWNDMLDGSADPSLIID